MTDANETHLEGLHCTMTIAEPAPEVVLVSVGGTDVGELGDAPFRVMKPLFAHASRVELFVDARLARGPSIDVSSTWAQWLARRQTQLLHVSMLTASRFVHLTAGVVRRFADLGELMRIYTEPAVFEGALWNAIGNGHARLRMRDE